MHDWYALHVRSNYELRIIQALAQTPVETFCPTQKVMSRFAKGGSFEKPWMAGYVFARSLKDLEPTDLLQFHGLLARTTGVVHILGFGSEPSPVPEDQMLNLQRLAASGFQVLPVQYSIAKAGDYVEVVKGPLTGVFGYVSYVRLRENKCRIAILCEMLNRAVSTELDADWISPAALPQTRKDSRRRAA